jgi:hypothetical protein
MATYAAGTAGALLGVYFLIALIVLIMPTKQRDPQMGAAQGCLFGLVLMLAVLGALLAIGAYWQLHWLVYPIAVIAIAPPAWLLLVAGPWYLILRLKRRRTQ